MAKKPLKTALFLGGGAPNFTLMSGALLALHERGYRNFDIISMAGAGAVVGLAYLAPKGGLRPEEALENTVNLGISDAIYRMLPVNYKAFGKSGPSAEAFNDWWYQLPAVRNAMHQLHMNDEEKLSADWLLFLGALMCPTDLNFSSKGICGHSRFIEGLIDFPKLRDLRTEVEINAFDIKAHDIMDFTNRDEHGRRRHIRVHHLRAALSFPFIYPPYEVDGKQFYEGAAFQTLNVIKNISGIDRFIVLNPLKRNLIRAPDDLWDAYTQSIIMPVTAIAEGQVKKLKGRRRARTKSERSYRPWRPAREASWIYYRGALQQLMTTLVRRTTQKERSALIARHAQQQWYFADLEIDDDRVDAALGWSRSSLNYLFKIGRQRGKKLADRLDEGKPHFTLADIAARLQRLEGRLEDRASRGRGAKAGAAP